VRFQYRFPKLEVDTSHRLFGIDHNRCILCTRCVRVCWYIEGAGTKNVSGRGVNSLIINDLNQPWADSDTCTSCGKCGFIRKVCSCHSNPPGVWHLEWPGPERRIEGKNTPVGDTPVGRAGTRKNPQPHAACRDGSPYRRWFPVPP
jgi:ferredoxin